MKTLEAICKIYPKTDFLIVDGFDEAVIGIEEKTSRIIYSITKCIEIIEAKGMPEQEALEYFYFEIKNSYIGEKAPIFCFDEFKNISNE